MTSEEPTTGDWFDDVIEPYDPSRFEWLGPLANYLVACLSNDGTTTARARLGSDFDRSYEGFWQRTAGMANSIGVRAACPWSDLRDSEWEALQEQLNVAYEGAAIEGWLAMRTVMLDALRSFEGTHPHLTDLRRARAPGLGES